MTFTSVKEKAQVAPCFAIGVQAGLEAGVRAALAKQNFEDWKVVPLRAWALDGFGDFQNDLGRYLLVVTDVAAFVEFLGRSQMAMTQTLLTCESSGRSLVVFTGRTGVIFYAIHTWSLTQHPKIPFVSDSSVGSLIQHLQQIGNRPVGEVLLDGGARSALSGILNTHKSSEITSYFSGPFGDQYLNPAYRARAIEILGAAPISEEIYCASNDYYGHMHVLRGYCGVPSHVLVHGRMQHGWMVGPVTLPFDEFGQRNPLYVWNPRMQGLVLAGGHTAGCHVIGSPWLYLPESPDPGPADQALLAIPHHSIRQKRIPPGAWSDWGKALGDCASRHGMSAVSVLLHPVDYYLSPAPEQMDKLGFRPLCCSPGYKGDGGLKGNEPEYLGRLRAFIRHHAAVVTDRLATPLFYALHENRPAWIDAPVLTTVPPDHYDDVTGDRDWIAAHFPGIAKGGLAGRDEAMFELGADHKKSPMELAKVLFGWLAS